MFGRRQAKTRRELVRSEFGESLDHFRRSATHAAGGLGATVGPNYSKAKDKVGEAREWASPTKVTAAAAQSWDATVAALAPLMQAAKDGSAKAHKIEARTTKIDSNGTKKVRKVVETTTPADHHMSGTVVALIATGAAVGAAGALAARRRNRVKWSEYEPSQLHSDAKGLLDSSSTATTSMSSSAGDMGEPGVIKKCADWTKEHAQNAYDSVRHKIHEATAPDHDMGDSLDRMKNTAGEMSDDARDTVRKANEHLNEGASHFGDKTKDKLNEASSRVSDTAKRTSDRTSDSVDDLLRSSKNGRM